MMLKSQARREVLHMLGLLACAREPLTLSMLKQFFGPEVTDRMEDLLTIAVDVFGSRPVGRSPEVPFRFFHSRFQEFILEEVGDRQVDLHARLADASLRWCQLDGDANTYALRYLPAHLREAHMWDELCDVLTDFDFLEAKISTATTSAIRNPEFVVHSFAGVLDLLRDYADALSSWPGSDEASRELQQAADLSEYRDHLLRFARGEDHTIVPPASKQPSVLGTTAAAARIDGIEVEPRLRVMAFRTFVATHARRLAQWSSSHPIVLQLAFNSARNSPVARAAERLLASASWPQLLEPAHLRRIWNLFPALIGTVQAHTFEYASDSVDSLDFSADGQQLLSYGAGQLRLWQLEHQCSLRARETSIAVGREKVRAARLSADACRIVSQHDSQISVWTPEGACDRQIMIAKSYCRGLTITADATWAATFRGRHFEEWDLQAASRHRLVETRSRDIDAITMSADGGRIVTAHHDLVIRLYDLASQASPHIVPLVGDKICAMRFAPDARLLVAYEKDREDFLAVLGHSGEWHLSLALGETRVQSIVVTTDASLVFVAQDNGIIRAFNLSTGNCVHAFHTVHESIDLIALRRRDSQLVAFSYDWHRRATETWTLATGHHTQRITSRDDAPWTPQALLPDGDTLVTGMLNEEGITVLEFWALRTGRLVRTLGPWEQARSKVVVPQDRRKLFTGSWQNGILEWDLDAVTPAQSIGEDGYTVSKFDADALGRVGVSSRGDESIRIWDLRRRVCVQEVVALSDWDAEVCISADGRLVASGDHEFVLRVWDGRPEEPRTETRRLTGHRSVISALALTPDGNKLMSGSWDTTARLWNLESGEARVLRGHEETVEFVALSADGKLGVSWSDDKTLRVWDLVTAQEIKVLERGSEDVESLSMTADGSKVATGDRHGRIKLWDVENGRLEDHERRHNWFVYTVCLLPASTILVSGSGDGTVGIWDLADRHRDVVAPAGDRVRDPDPSKVQHIVPLADGFASTGQDGAIRIWDVASRECLAVLRSRGEPWGDCNVAHLAATPDGLCLVSASDTDNYIRVWNVARRMCIRSIRAADYGVQVIALSAHGRTVVSVASAQKDYVMQLWDLEDSRCLRAIPFKDGVLAARFTPRGDRVLLKSGRHVELWDPMLGERIWHTSGYLAALNPAGNDTVVVSEDVMYRIDLVTGEPILEFRSYKDRLSDLQVTADGNWLLSAGDDRTVRVWSIDSGECIAIDALESRPKTLSRVSAQGLFAYGTEAGEVLIRQLHGINIGPFLVTPVRGWIADESPHWDSRLVVCCPECTRITAVPDAGPSAEAITPCPGCGTYLRLTPFVVDPVIE